MKICIMSDTHLSAQKYNKMNKKLNINQFLVRQFESFEWCLNYCKNNNIDTIVHAGDVFDSSVVSVYPLHKFTNLVKDFKFFAIKGNHDDNNFLHNANLSALDLVGINAFNKPGNVDLDGINFVFVPWGFEIDENLIDKFKYNVLIAHGCPKDYKYFSADIPTNKSKLFDFVITGHYHMIDEFTIDNTKYLNPGSLSAYANEAGLVPSIWIFDTKTKQYERVVIPCAIKCIDVKPKDVNNFISDIKDEDIFRIRTSIIPDKRELLKAKKIALDIQFKFFDQENLNKKEIIDEFWTYVKKEKKEWELDFKKIINDKNGVE